MRNVLIGNPVSEVKVSEAIKKLKTGESSATGGIIAEMPPNKGRRS